MRKVLFVMLIILVMPIVYSVEVGRFGTQAADFFTSFQTNGFLRNNTLLGKIYLNASNGMFISNTLNANKFSLTNGSAFDIIYGRNLNAISNNTAQGKAYINSSLYPSNIRFGTWNITLDSTASKLRIFANGSGYINRANQSTPYSSSGCFRIHGDDRVVYTTSGTGPTIPGTIHLGSECTQGWPQAYIDINDVNQNTSISARLMQFFWTNTGPINGIGLSMSLKSKSIVTILQDLNWAFNGAGGQSLIAQLFRISILSSTANNSIPVGKIRGIDLFPTFTTSSNFAGSVAGVSIFPIASSNKIRGFAGIEIRNQILATRNVVIGLFMGRQAKTSTAVVQNRSYAVLSEGSPIQLSAGSPYIYNGPFITTDNWYNITLGNVSTFYGYNQDALFTQFAGRTAGLFNLTSMSKRQYNMSFAGGIYINSTLRFGNKTNNPMGQGILSSGIVNMSNGMITNKSLVVVQRYGGTTNIGSLTISAQGNGWVQVSSSNLLDAANVRYIIMEVQK